MKEHELATKQFEVELKLELNRDDAANLLTSLPKNLRGGKKEVFETVYFDTAKQHLRQSGFSIRVRHIGERRIQTLKADGDMTAGLFVRPEWEREIEGDTPMFNHEISFLYQFVPEAVLCDLRPIFQTVVKRTLFEAIEGSGRVEVAVDQGGISGAGAKRRIYEIELELKRGPPALLFKLARKLNGIVPARLGVQSKAERGYDLVHPRKAHAVKAEPVLLTVDMISAKALQMIAQSCIRQFRLNEAVLSTRDDGDALHQARVALRRLRSALSIFKRMLADDRYEPLRKEVKWMAVKLGNARNIDVLIARRDDTSLPRTIRAARRKAYVQARTALASTRWRVLMLNLTEWLTAGHWLTNPKDPSLCDEPISHRAKFVLDRSWKRLKRRGQGMARLDDDACHRVRIEAKKLRYAAEFFSALPPGKTTNQHKRLFAKAVEALLDSLGELNDLVTAPALMKQAGLIDDAQMTHVRSRKRLLARAERRYDALLRVKRFWR